MSKQTFTTGQVLTAAQMTSLQQTAMGGGSTTAKTASYVLVAADAGTVVQMNAAGATTITVDTALFAAGDSVQIQNVGAGVCTVTAGTATVSTAGSLALSQYEAGQLYFNTTSAALFFDIVQSSGMTNPMTTTGDIIYSSSGSTPARLGIGTTGQVLNVASGLPAWTTASAGAMVLVTRSTFSNVAGTNIDSVFSSTYKTYLVVVEKIYGGTGADDFYFQWRYGSSTQSANYNGNHARLDPNSATFSVVQVSGAAQFTISTVIGESTYDQSCQFYCNNVGNSSQLPSLVGQGMMAGFYNYGHFFTGMAGDARTYTGFRLSSSSSNITGVVSVYGLATA